MTQTSYVILNISTKLGEKNIYNKNIDLIN